MKITKIQNEFKIISSLTPEEIQKLAKAKQNVLYEDKKPVFGIGMSNTNAQFDAKAVTFNEVSDSGFAMLTLVMPVECNEITNEEAIKAFSENNYEAINALAAAEPEFKTILNSIDARVSEITGNINVINVD